MNRTIRTKTRKTQDPMSKNNTQRAKSFEEAVEAREVERMYFETLDEGGTSRLVLVDGSLGDDTPIHGYIVAMTDAFKASDSAKVGWPYIVDVISDEAEFNSAYKSLHDDIMKVYKLHPWSAESLFMDTRFNTELERIEIEASVHIKDIKSAMFLACSTNQRWIHDLRNCRYIETHR